MKTKNTKATQVTRGLLKYLKKTGQLGILPQLVSETIKKTQTHSDPTLAKVTTAVKLDASEQKAIGGVLSTLVGRQMKVENVVDDQVIAGMHIRIGDKVIDNTIQEKIKKLSERLTQ